MRKRERRGGGRDYHHESAKIGKQRLDGGHFGGLCTIGDGVRTHFAPFRHSLLNIAHFAWFELRVGHFVQISHVLLIDQTDCSRLLGLFENMTKTPRKLVFLNRPSRLKNQTNTKNKEANCLKTNNYWNRKEVVREVNQNDTHHQRNPEGRQVQIRKAFVPLIGLICTLRTANFPRWYLSPQTISRTISFSFLQLLWY